MAERSATASVSVSIGSTARARCPAVGAPFGEITLFSPRRVRQDAPQVPLPASFTTVDDILLLPLRSFSITVGPGTVLWQGFRDRKVARSLSSLCRRYVAGPPSTDVELWPRMVVRAECAQPRPHRSPRFSTPILGTDGLRPPAARTRNFSPTLGFAWTATRDGKTVRARRGRTLLRPRRQHQCGEPEQRASPPVAVGHRQSDPDRRNILHEGRALDFLQPTSFTGAQLLAILPGIRAELLQSINPDNRDFSVRNLDRAKEGENLYDPSYATPYAVHASLGLQRELARELRLSVDVAWKRFVHTFINGIDYNRWIPAQAGSCTAVIPPLRRRAAERSARGLLERSHVFRHDRRPGPLPRAAGARRKTFFARDSVSGLLCARQLHREPTAREPARRKTPVAGCSASTTTTGSRTRGRCRPISATS